MGTYTNIVHGANATIAVGEGDLGYLKGPVVVGIEGDDLLVDVDSQIMPVTAFRTSKVFYVKATLAEPTAANIAHAWDETVATLGINAAGEVFDPTIFTGAGTGIIITGDAPSATGETRTVTLNGGIATDFGELTYEKGSPVLLAITFKFVLTVPTTGIGSIAQG